MTDRKLIADALFNVLWNCVSHHLLTVVSLFAAWLTPRARAALAWLQARMRNRSNDATPSQGNVRITPPSGSITISGMPSKIPPPTTPAGIPKAWWGATEAQHDAAIAAMGFSPSTTYGKFAQFAERRPAEREITRQIWGTTAATE